MRRRNLAMVGGKAYGMRPSQFDRRQLERGTRVEMEHTNKRKIAREIAMDHLVEDPNYYKKLARYHLDGYSRPNRSMAVLALLIIAIPFLPP